MMKKINTLFLFTFLFAARLFSQNIERISFSAAASNNDNFQPVVGAPYGVSISGSTGSLEVSAEYGESNYVPVSLKNNLLITQSNIKVYPNPTQDKVIIDLAQVNYKETQISITDMQGKLINRQNASTNLESIDMNTYATGVYFINVEVKGSKNQIYRIVKK